MSTLEFSRQDAKFDLWERKLLDLTARNSLLNVKMKGNTIPVITSSSAKIEDLLSAEKDYAILSSKNEENGEPKDTEAGLANGELYSDLTESELAERLKALYRNSRTAIEEDGAGTLFLACGLLKWIDENKENTYYAPIVLVPVELIRKFGVGRYVMRKTDGDTVVNITLTEKLRKDFDIDIDELTKQDIPQDESGVDVQGVFDTLKNALASKKDWEVVDSCVLGMFSFSQFVMWNDLHNHRDEIAQNKIVKSLIEGKLTWEYEDMEAQAGGFKDESEVYLPIAADSSQLYAIYKAGKGESFVLHGPPGTGKSQTITSMIANALVSGKRVLFAAEKKAALDVVYTRLNKIGIAPFCLELHSNKAVKGKVLDQLKEALEAKVKAQDSGEYDKMLADINARKAELDIYIDELTKRRDSGYTLCELMSIYAQNQDETDIILEDGFADGVTEDRINASVTAIGELIAAGRGMSGVLPFVKATEYSQDSKIKLEGELNALLTKTQNLETAFTALRNTFPGIETGNDLAAAGRAASKIEEFFNARKAILLDWDAGFLKQDADALKNSYDAASKKWALLRSSAVKKVYDKVSAFDKNKNAKDDLGRHIDELKAYKDRFKAMGFDVEGGIAPSLPEFKEAYRQFEDASSPVYGRLVIDELKPGSGVSFEDIRSIINNVRSNESQIRPKTIFNRAASNCKELKLASVIRAFEEGRLNEEQLTPAFNKAWSKLLICEAIDGSPILSNFSGKVYEEKIAQLKKISDEFEKVTRQQIYLKIARRMPDFSIKAAAASELGKLQRAIKSRGRGRSLRSLFTELQELMLQLTPCVLMSPKSAAQFVAPTKEPMFDLVIFDEASQLPTSEAVGVLARGREAIIVGDPNQMPPTSFFKEQSFDEDNFEYEDLESILDDCLAVGMPQSRLLWHYRSRHESLITFSNKSFYESKLYTFPSADDRKSRVTVVKCNGVFDSGKTRTNEAEARAVVEELIARSKDPDKSGYTCGVVTFNIQQQNLIEDMIDEACIADEQFEQWAYGGTEPVFIKNLENVQGDERDVILFSVSYGPDPDGKVSMNFGPLNRDGGWRRLNVAVTRSRIEMKVFASLSPEQMRISEATPEGVKAFKRFLQYAEGDSLWDSDLTGAASSSPVIDRTENYRGVARNISSRLLEKGYNTDLNVGKSGFKVDIGVYDKNSEGSYCLGILIDGASDGNSSSAVREIAQPATLKGLGWKIKKVWSIEWWENPDAVIDEIIEAINSVDEPLKEEPEPVIEQLPEDTQKKTENLSAPAGPVSYIKAEVTLPPLTAQQFADPVNISLLKREAVKVIEAEAPVSMDTLMDRLCEACGIKRKTNQVKERCYYICKELKLGQSVENLTKKKDSNYSDPGYEKLFLFASQDDVGKITQTFRVHEDKSTLREAKDISVEEAACAAIYTARTQMGMPYEDLLVEAGKAMGLPMSTPTSKLLFAQAVDLAVMRGELTHGDRIVK
ncbi:MAG: DUF3320 domain-containing protein [Saccharofermentans sp.]|nr:DUF3320 domain-containing protein [Saccharofermentans sp.]